MAETRGSIIVSGKIAIVGAGPSGCYLAQALLKSRPDLQVDLIDALPVPFGLARYGVAADHQGTKAVTRQFSRIFERQGARFFGNLRIGRDVPLEQLRAAYDATVLAAGLSADRRLNIPGEDLPGVHGSAKLTRALNEHPQAVSLPDLGSHPVILGNGNVALDLLRLMCKTPAELDGSDLGPGPTAWLAANRIERLTIVGRSPAAHAKFDPVMVRELGKLSNVSIEVEKFAPSDDPDTQKRQQALTDIDGHGEGPVRVVFRFGLQPTAIEGVDRVTGLAVEGTGGRDVIKATSIITAIGFASAGDLGREALLSGGALPDGKLDDGLYGAGWFRHGPRGTIAQSRSDAQATAAMILKELSIDPARVGNEIFAGLPELIDFAGWQRIDAAEQALAAPSRCRRKFTSTDDLLHAARQRD
ncbi:oxidoreductase [Rhodobacterales bacterium]|nr:oxidoreductase [Rhodobacterales bacterium]